MPQLWALATLACIFAILGLLPVRPHDFWWHLRAGQWIVEHGRVPATDLFTFTRAGEPWAYQSWLMEVAFYLLLRAGDLPLVILVHAAVVTAAYGLLLRVSQRAAAGDLRWAAIATAAAAAVGANSWNVRPQAISILLFALTLYLIERHAGQRGVASGRDRVLWWLVPLFILWANAHGGFVFGLALLGTYLTACLLAWLRGQRRFPTIVLLVTVLCALATLLTPLGLGMVDYLLGFLRHPVTRSLNQEFQPLTVQSREGWLFFGFVVALVALLLVSRYRPASREWLRILLFAALALVARRNAIWFGFVAAPTAAAALGLWAGARGSAKDQHARRSGINRVFAASIGLLAMLSLPWLRPYLPLPEGRRAYLHPETPVQAVAFLRELPLPRRVFHPDAYGSYMIWASPEVPAFIDTRIELYPPAQWADYLALSQARYDWEAILARYGVDTLLLDREMQGPLIETVTQAPVWERCYEDEQAVIFLAQGCP